MLSPFIKRARIESKESGITLALVAAAMVTIIGMAALSIDIGTLYQAKAEAQRAADAAALSAARVISLSGITADPTSGPGDGSWSAICGGTGSTATQTATLVAQQSTIGGQAVSSSGVNVTYGAGPADTPNSSCTSMGADFAINPIVNVTVQRTNLPVFFARVFSLVGASYSGSSVSATASAEAYNPSDSGHGSNVGDPVQPRCVKPWIIPNSQGSGGLRFVHRMSGRIGTPGIQQVDGTGYVGQEFWLKADCASGGSGCSIPATGGANPPNWTTATSGTPGTIWYIPANITGTPLAVPSCSAPSSTFQAAVAGCDQSTVYACGYAAGSAQAITEANLGEYPGGGTGDTAAATACLINQTGTANSQDQLVISSPPYQTLIVAGSSNPLTAGPGVTAGDNITSSTSIVTIPIAEFNGAPLPTGGTGTTSVSIVGFLQAFINNVDTSTGATGGNVNVTIMNVTGCGYAASGSPVYGTSPVPVRLITPP